MLASSILLAVAVATASAKTVTYRWSLTNTTMNLDGVDRHGLSINNRPGHQHSIEVESGDRVVLHLNNELAEPASIHFHGITHRDGSTHMDGPAMISQCPVPPGGRMTYNFTVDAPGTYWWHSHNRLQMMDGLRGPFIVREKEPAYKYDYDISVQLADWHHTPWNQVLDRYLGPIPRQFHSKSALINGRGQYNCTANNLTLQTTPSCQWKRPSRITLKKNATTRIRFLNVAGNQAYRVSLDGHNMTVIENDGVLVQPYLANILSINTAQRYSVLVTPNPNATETKFWMRSLVSDCFCATRPSEDVPDFIDEVKAIIEVSDTFAKPDVIPPGAYSLPTSAPHRVPMEPRVMSLVPLEPMTPPPLGPDGLDLLFTFNMTKKGDDTYKKAYIQMSSNEHPEIRGGPFETPLVPTLLDVMMNNKTTLESLPSTSNIVTVKKNQVVQITMYNSDPNAHPFHLHGHTFWVMESSGGLLANLPRNKTYTNPNPVRRDTFTLLPGIRDANGTTTMVGWSVIRFVADNPGVWLFHCHQEFHLEPIGLMVTFVEAADELVTRPVPQTNIDTCRSYEEWKAKSNGGPY
ncbi:hypothetical protein HDU67_003454 [Dinochytrium kinnereticum]|nr:hypothetical protein HDU67_003454 [Dinochytrium kinnereticum]